MDLNEKLRDMREKYVMLKHCITNVMYRVVVFILSAVQYDIIQSLAYYRYDSYIKPYN